MILGLVAGSAVFCNGFWSGAAYAAMQNVSMGVNYAEGLCMQAVRFGT
jgi:hypothetical protein